MRLLNVISNFFSFIVDRLSVIQMLHPKMWKKKLRLPVAAVVQRFSSILSGWSKAKYPESQLFSCLSSFYEINGQKKLRFPKLDLSCLQVLDFREEIFVQILSTRFVAGTVMLSPEIRVCFWFVNHVAAFNLLITPLITSKYFVCEFCYLKFTPVYA